MVQIADGRVIQKNLRPVLSQRPNIQYIDKIKIWLDAHHDHYMGFGGMGDALLLLASCSENKSAKVLFFANDPSMSFIREFFDLFKIPSFILPNIMGQPLSTIVYDAFKAHPKSQTSAHLADHLYHGDWVNEEKYTKRIKKNTNWLEIFGKEDNDKIVCISPCGSHRDGSRQRYLSNGELSSLVKKYNKEYKVYAVGANRETSFYNIVPDSYWMTSNYILDSKGNKTEIDLNQMLRIINSSTEIISVDTWLKTYGLLVGLPTTVIKTRWNGKYRNYGDDPTDLIFLNSKLWPDIKLKTIEELLIC